LSSSSPSGSRTLPRSGIRLYVKKTFWSSGLEMEARGTFGPGSTDADPAVVKPVLVKPSFPTALSVPFGHASDGS
jgi:hypothetical protein